MEKFLYFFLIAVSFVLVGTITVDSAFAQSYTGVLTLDPLPSKVRTGDIITFSGKFVTTSGHTVSDATIYIKDDVAFGRDKIIGTVITDKNGKFSATWKAVTRSSGSYDFYAIYEGGTNVSKSRSLSYTVSVSSSYTGGSSSSSPSSSSGANIKTYAAPTVITLDKIPSSIHAGQTVTFTGKLTSNGKAVTNAFVKIMEDDPFSPDQRLAYDRTDSNGKFSIPWKVSAGLVETDFDVYAVFDGDSSYKRARSYNQEMSVLKYGGSISLNSFPTRATVGDVITFSGKLDLNQGSPQGAVVYIKDEDPFNPDDLLATAYVDSFGKFSANWFVTNVDSDSVADIYAVFEGNDLLYRLTTCDRGPTLVFGASCQHTIPLTTLIPATPPPQPPTGSPTDTTLTGNEYMKLYYSLDLNRNPKVAIIPSPDSYDEVRKHIIPIQEGIKTWESQLERKYGGTWDVSFEVIQPGKLFFQNKPDIVMNLVTPDKDTGCLYEYSGWAKIWRGASKPIQTQVCSNSPDVGATAAHEFIHAMGLGHTFNMKGDLMCSAEYSNGKWVPTCPSSFFRSNQPSDFNLAAVSHLYNFDGFKNPNNRVSYESKFTVNDYLGKSSSPTIPKPTPTPTPTPKTINLDSDGDGIPNSRDLCDYDKETFNFYKDTDGCPDTKPRDDSNETLTSDYDGDGIVDIFDSCKYQRETKNGYKDSDGCPDTKPSTINTNKDSDKDGIPDYKDRCDYQKENYNGYKDTDGCPDTKPVDWKKKALASQSQINAKIIALKSGISEAENSLSGLHYGNSEAQNEVEKAWTALWYAKKYLGDAEWTQKEGEQLISKSKFKEGFYKHSYSFEKSTLIEVYLSEITMRLDIAHRLQYGN